MLGGGVSAAVDGRGAGWRACDDEFGVPSHSSHEEVLEVKVWCHVFSF